MSPELEVIVCYCLKCGLKVGSFDNSWEGLGKTYYMPKITRDATGLKGVGTIKLAAGPTQVGTIIENSSLQDLACAECSEVFGLRCDSAPEGHLLKRDQLLLCAKKLSMESQQTREKAVLAVTRTHDLRKSSNNSSVPSRRPSSALSRIFYPASISRQSIEKPFAPIPSSPPMLGDTDIISTVREQRKDIDRIDAAVGRLEKDMLDVKFLMEDLRREMTEIRSNRPITGSDIDTLKTDIFHVTEKANEVDDLRSELKSLRTRVKDMEQAAREALTLDTRLAISPSPSHEQQERRSLQKSVSNERGYIEPRMAKSRGISSRKRRYSEKESDQMEDKVSKLARSGQRKRRRQLEVQQDEASESSSIPPTRFQTEEPATLSKPRIESPILGSYDENGDIHHIQQDDDQHMEDTERQIPESPSQHSKPEMNNPDERCNNDEHQDFQHNSQTTPNQIPEPSKETSPSQNSDISFEISRGYPITSHLHLPQIFYQSPYAHPEIPNSPQSELLQVQSPYQPLEIPNSSQPFQNQPSQNQLSQNQPSQNQPSNNTQDNQEPQLPTLTHRSRGRPKGSSNKIKNIATSDVIVPSSEELTTHARALRKRINPGLNLGAGEKAMAKKVANTPRNNIIIDLTGGFRGIWENPPAPPQESHSALGQDLEMENTSQPAKPTKRPRRNTRSSRQRPSVDLDEVLKGIIISDDENPTEKQPKRDARFIGGVKRSDEDETYTEKEKRQQREKDQVRGCEEDPEAEREWERGREEEREGEIEMEQEKRRSTRRRKELEMREELVKQALERGS
ncbi:hypothetical protein NHQ30_001021 [Ciborinia camelliae]|nr:hypothetical protein NHQ30_001021 [Ciborinia camelliae]